jgi:hypothetical protein
MPSPIAAPLHPTFMACDNRRVPDVVVPADHHHDYFMLRQRVNICAPLPLKPVSQHLNFGSDVIIDGRKVHLLGASSLGLWGASSIEFEKCRRAVNAEGAPLPYVVTLGHAKHGRCVSVHSVVSISVGPQLTLPVSRSATDAGLIVGNGRTVLIVLSPRRAEIHCFGGAAGDFAQLRAREPMYERVRKNIMRFSALETGVGAALACAVLVGAICLSRRIVGHAAGVVERQR